MLFHKALVLTDLHFGRSGNSPVANQDNLDFLAWAIDLARSWGADRAIMAGDWHDNRNALQLATMHASLQGMEMLNAALPTDWLLGNHDLFYRNRRDIASTTFGRYLPNIHFVRDPITRDDVSFLPWLVGDEVQTMPAWLAAAAPRYVFAHLELPGFLMNAAVKMPDTPHAMQAEQFSRQDWVFTGHFHKRQTSRNICYLGNIMPFNFSDSWDSERGVMLLEWGKDPVFHAWPEQPLYRAMKLSEVLARPAALLAPKMSVRAVIDMAISFEEAQAQRDALTARHGLRRFELVPQVQAQAQPEVAAVDCADLSVDQIVEQGLASIESEELSPDELVSLYRSVSEQAA